MAGIASKAEILNSLKAEAKRLGLVLHDESGEGFKGEVESIRTARLCKNSIL